MNWIRHNVDMSLFVCSRCGYNTKTSFNILYHVAHHKAECKVPQYMLCDSCDTYDACSSDTQTGYGCMAFLQGIKNIHKSKSIHKSKHKSIHKSIHKNKNNVETINSSIHINNSIKKYINSHGL